MFSDYEAIAADLIPPGTAQIRLKYNGTEIKPSPVIVSKGLNSAYKASASIRDGLQRWDVRLSFNLMTRNGLTAATTLANFSFGAWELSEDDGQTWLKTFIDDIPERDPIGYRLTLARGITDANLVVTYDIPGGTFSGTDSGGNPIEETTSGTLRASVSQGRTRSQIQESPGNSPGRIALEGFVTDANGEPTELPTDYQLQRYWPATLDMGGGRTVTGEFIGLIYAQEAWAANEQQRGSTFQGEFRTTSN